jgi:hypothetical protein
MANNLQINNDVSVITDIIKLYQDNYFYRHANYWGVIYKSMISILGLLSLPYFLYKNMDNILLILFPSVSIIISIFSILILESEAKRMNLSRDKMNELLGKLSLYYKEKNIDNVLKRNKKNKLTLWSKLIKSKITTKMLFLYILLFFLSVFEIYIIYNNILFIKQ